MKNRQFIFSPFAEHIVLGTMLLVAFALRLYRLDAQALWWDESLSVYRATRDWGTVLSNTILIQNLVTVDTLPQLYFVLLNVWVRAAGISEFVLRFFSVIANVATLPLIYVLARRWLNPSAAWVAMGLGALSPFYVWYAQEARPYTLVLFWSTLAIYALTRALHDSRFTQHALRWTSVYVLASIAALYTHYYSVFLLPFHSILIAIGLGKNSTSRERAWILLPAFPALSMIFLLPQILASIAGNVNWGPVFVPLQTILLDLLNSFSIGVTADLNAVWWIDGVLLGLFIIGLFQNLKSQNSNPKIGIWNLRFGLLVLGFFLVPVLGVFAASFIRPLYQNSRYLISISPAFYLGVAAGIVVLARRVKWIAVPALAVYVIGAIISLNNWYFNPQFGKDDHRGWAASLHERVLPGDFLILDSPHTEELYRYYADDLVPMMTLPILRADGQPSPEADWAAVRQAYRQNARVWFLALHVPFDDPQQRIEKLLHQEGVLIDRAQFAGTSTAISLSLFMPAMPIVQPSEIARPLDIAFAGNLRLRGYDAPASLRADQPNLVKLFWQIDEPVGEDYAVSLRLVDDAGKIIVQHDAVLLGNRAGTSTWQPKQIVVETRALALTRSIVAGTYSLQVVPYHITTGNALGDVITLASVEVP